MILLQAAIVPIYLWLIKSRAMTLRAGVMATMYRDRREVFGEGSDEGRQRDIPVCGAGQPEHVTVGQEPLVGNPLGSVEDGATGVRCEPVSFPACL
uniref:Putative secreted protein n=1 Tax=Ixodes ricinus TaxID=34613 RepID=A0A6B0UF84_IXORI